MTSALEAYRAIPLPYRKASFQVLCSARRRRRDGWPLLPAIVNASRNAGLKMEYLAAMFGYMVSHRFTNAVVFHDTMRNSDISPDIVYDARLRPFYEFFRAAMAADEKPIHKRRPRYSGEEIKS